MEIGVVYSSKDPKQLEARNFVRKFVHERGILASIFEYDRPVESPTVIINGQALKEQRRRPRDQKTRMFPGIRDIARALEEYTWSL